MLKPQFKIQILYKNGISFIFWTKSFQFKDGTYTCESANHQRPLVLGADEIAAVFQLGVRYRF